MAHVLSLAPGIFRIQFTLYSYIFCFEAFWANFWRNFTFCTFFGYFGGYHSLQIGDHQLKPFLFFPEEPPVHQRTPSKNVVNWCINYLPHSLWEHPLHVLSSLGKFSLHPYIKVSSIIELQTFHWAVSRSRSTPPLSALWMINKWVNITDWAAEGKILKCRNSSNNLLHSYTSTLINGDLCLHKFR